MKELFNETTRVGVGDNALVYAYGAESFDVVRQEWPISAVTVAHYDRALGVLVIDCSILQERGPVEWHTTDRILTSCATRESAIRLAVHAADAWGHVVESRMPARDDRSDDQIVADARRTNRIIHPDF